MPFFVPPSVSPVVAETDHSKRWPDFRCRPTRGGFSPPRKGQEERPSSQTEKRPWDVQGDGAAGVGVGVGVGRRNRSPGRMRPGPAPPVLSTVGY